MSKKNAIRPLTTTRSATPRVQKEKDGSVVLLCPFCQIPHPLRADGQSACGTAIEVVAKQIVINAKFRKELVCAKCGKGGGQMVAFNRAFIHVEDCMPGMATLVEPPKYSMLAKFVFRMKAGRLKNFMEDRYGEAKEIAIVSPTGERTGQINYFFYRSQNGKHPQVSTG